MRVGDGKVTSFKKFPIKDVSKVGSSQWYLFKEYEEWRTDTINKIEKRIAKDKKKMDADLAYYMDIRALLESLKNE